MRPEIERYLREHAERYTTEALRRALLDAGFGSAEVDAAVREWQAKHRIGRADAAGRGNFWLWAGLIHVAALVLVVLLLVIVNGIQALGIVLIAAAVMALVMLVGWGLSGLIGRALLPAVPVWVALILPALSALLIGGACLALIGGVPGVAPEPAPMPGAVELQIDPPLDFSGSGEATCFLQPDASGLSVNAGNLGTLEGRTLTASVEVFRPGAGPVAPAPAEDEREVNVIVTITLQPTGRNEIPTGYSSADPTTLEVDASPDMLSGTARFERLEPMAFEGPNPELEGDPVSGTISWTCR